ncbi:MAG: DUF418 domain-containing protein [Planctomycetota bacterium]
MDEQQPDAEAPIEPVANADQAPPTEQPPRARPKPIRVHERIEAVDTLRGVALLGILTMNIAAFAWPMGGYENPRFSGGDEPANTAFWAFNSVVFSGKMMSLFSMLFGAGLVVMNERAAARGASLRGVYYRRNFWLLVIGMVHAYLIWGGDVLVPYALCGFVLYPFRRFRAGTLIAVGTLLVIVQVAVWYAFLNYGAFIAGVAEEAAAARADGVEPEDWQAEMEEVWAEGFRPLLAPSEEDIQDEIGLYLSSYPEIVRGRAEDVLMFQTFGFLMIMSWGASGRMLIGMGLMKLGVFSAERSTGFYSRLAALGYGLGLPLTAAGMALTYHAEYELVRTPGGAALFTLGMVPVAIGHAAVVTMLCKNRVWPRLAERLAAVGRTALSNYLLQSLVCTTLFYGYGLALFGRLDRVALWGVVLGVWALQLWASPVWLSRFRFGPAEWLWRSLTYGRRQRMLKPDLA